MCFVLTLVLSAAAIAFYRAGAIPNALFSGGLAVVMLMLFVRRIIRNRRELFGGCGTCRRDDAG